MIDSSKLLLQGAGLRGRYNPLERILFYDDFDYGTNGWCELVGNHAGDLRNIRKTMADLRPPQLSNCTFFDIGTHGAVEGNYALKLATRARAGSQAALIKRLTYAGLGLVQFETYFTFKSEQRVVDQTTIPDDWDGNRDPSENDFGEFALSNDVCEGDRGPRYLMGLRYVNAAPDGSIVNKWMYKTSLHTTTKMARTGRESQSDDIHVRNPEDWKDVPGGAQSMCFNETATKINWHYLRWRFDTRARRGVELQVNDHVMDLRSIEVPVYDHEYTGLTNLLNFLVDVRTRRPVRNFLYLDSVVVSVDW